MPSDPVSDANALPLAGHRVWLTRPLEQVTGLQQALERLGAAVLPLPLLNIRPLVPTQTVTQTLINLDQYDLVFYVSTNAATLGLDAIGQWWLQYPVHIQNFAVGPSTAAVLEQHGLSAHFPRERMSSEALLAMPELQDIAGKKALLVRGVGGREIIAEGLVARGAQVAYAELYERVLPAYDRGWLAERLRHDYPDAVVVSSAEALDNLQQLFAPVSTDWRRLPLVLSSPRLVEHAAAHGFSRTFLIDGATDAAIIAGLLTAFGGPAPT
jgi:uroporphyrinogen-III synthase